MSVVDKYALVRANERPLTPSPVGGLVAQRVTEQSIDGNNCSCAEYKRLVITQREHESRDMRLDTDSLALASRCAIHAG